MQHRTSVGELVGQLYLPDPTVPVPFERFASLKDSEDMLERAAFWAFYAAWQTEQVHTQQSGPNALELAVEARHDGHTLQAIAQRLHITDSVLVRRDHLKAMTQRADDAGDLSWSWATFIAFWCIVLGVGIGYWLSHVLQ